MTVWSGAGGGPGGGRPDHSPRPGGGRRDGTSPSVPVPHEQPVTSGSLCVTSGSLWPWARASVPPINSDMVLTASPPVERPAAPRCLQKSSWSWGKGVILGERRYSLLVLRQANRQSCQARLLHPVSLSPLGLVFPPTSQLLPLSHTPQPFLTLPPLPA